MDKKIECADALEVEGEGGTVKVENDDRYKIKCDQNSSYCFSKHVEQYNLQTVSFEQTSSYSLEEIEQVDDKIEEERDKINHILEIKELLLVNDENEMELIASLQMLKYIVSSFEHLTVTNIVTTVSVLQLHWSRKVIQEANKLVGTFKKIIEERIDENAHLSEITNGPSPGTVLNEDLLLNLPMDGGIPIGDIPELDLTMYFEDIDDDGNLIINNYESKEFHESHSTQKNTNMKLQRTGEESVSISTIEREKQELIDKLIGPKDNTPSHKNCENETKYEGQIYPPLIAEKKRKGDFLLKEDSHTDPTNKRQKHENKEPKRKRKNRVYYRPSDTECSLERFRRQREQIQMEDDRTTEKEDTSRVHQRLINASPRHSGESSDDAATLEEKLQNTKRKLHQGYQAHKNARRTTVYIAEHYDIPKENHRRRRLNWRYNNKSWRL